MGSETVRDGRDIRRTMAIAAGLALCVGFAYAADAPKAEKAPAKKPVASSKSTAAPAAKSKTTSASTPASAKKTCVPAANCKTPANFVEPVCAPTAQQAAAQKFNTLEDIYSPPPKNE